MKAKKTKPIPKAKRIRYYKKMFEIMKEEEYLNGICIVLGKVAFGCFQVAPFVEWREVCEYFPELKKLKAPESKGFSVDERKARIRQLKRMINKK